MTDYGSYQPTFVYDQPNARGAAAIIGEMLGLQLRDTRPELFLSAEEERYGRECVGGGKPAVAIHLASAFGPNKSWPFERWVALVESRPDLTFVQIGLPSEARLPGALDCRGTSIRAIFSIINACAAYVGIESGFAHAAYAFGTSAVVLFGPSTPRLWGHQPNINVYHRQPCSPCVDLLNMAPCPYGTPCMSAISTEQVAAALDAHLCRDQSAPASLLSRPSGDGHARSPSNR
jgi:ADP-heptose:LPS heptosyltransferase